MSAILKSFLPLENKQSLEILLKCFEDGKLLPIEEYCKEQLISNLKKCTNGGLNDIRLRILIDVFHIWNILSELGKHAIVTEVDKFLGIMEINNVETDAKSSNVETDAENSNGVSSNIKAGETETGETETDAEFDKKDATSKAPFILDLCAGSGFMAKQINDFITTTTTTHIINWCVIPIDNMSEPVARDFQYLSVKPMTALESIEYYPECRMFIASRGRDFMVQWLDAIVQHHPTGPLLLILATEGEGGCCEPEEFFEKLEIYRFTYKIIDDGLFYFPRCDKHDNLIIYTRE